MKVLVACEESQRVCTAFRERGHEAYSSTITTMDGVTHVVEPLATWCPFGKSQKLSVCG